MSRIEQLLTKAIKQEIAIAFGDPIHMPKHQFVKWMSHQVNALRDKYEDNDTFVNAVDTLIAPVIPVWRAQAKRINIQRQAEKR